MSRIGLTGYVCWAFAAQAASSHTSATPKNLCMHASAVAVTASDRSAAVRLHRALRCSPAAPLDIETLATIAHEV
jgi:hypothetical protein